MPPDILEHLPPKNQSLPTLLLCALTSDFTGGCPPPPSHSLCQRVNLQLQLIKFLGNWECLNPNPSDGSLTRLTSLPGHLQLCIRLFTVSQPPEAPSRRTDYRRHGLHSEARLGSGVLARTHAHMHTHSWCFKLPSAPLLQPLLCAFKHLSSDSTCCLISLAGCCLLCLSELPEIIGGFL